MAIGVTGAKVVSMILSGGVSLLLGLLPIKLKKFASNQSVRHQTIFSSLLCFGGGVLMATCFAHVLPEVRESLGKAIENKDIPVAEILLCVGFFLSYFIEEFVHFTSDRTLTHNSQNCSQPSHEQGLDVHRVFSVHSGACEVREEEQCIMPEESETGLSPLLTGSDVAVPSASSSSYNTFPGGSHDDAHNDIETRPDPNHLPDQLSSVKNLLTVVALSSHAVFEGLTVGLADTVNSVWTLFFAISLHKYVLSFCVGLELFGSGRSQRMVMNVCYIIIFAIMTPLGMAIGIAISATSSESRGFNLTSGILQALSAGAILYVVVFEVLQRERSKEQVVGLVQLGFVILGFGMMLGLELGVSDD